MLPSGVLNGPFAFQGRARFDSARNEPPPVKNFGTGDAAACARRKPNTADQYASFRVRPRPMIATECQTADKCLGDLCVEDEDRAQCRNAQARLFTASLYRLIMTERVAMRALESDSLLGSQRT
jgi:hypothetical protein